MVIFTKIYIIFLIMHLMLIICNKLAFKLTCVYRMLLSV